MGNSHNGDHNLPAERLVQVGPNFWNIRGDFTAFKLFEIGTHFSVIKLENNKFLVIDTIPLDPDLKTELDRLTNNGEDIEAVIATHPFHTVFFPDFYKAYPKPAYYGTARHIRNQPDIPWVADVNTPEVLNKWAPYVQMRIPAGAEFNAPKPETVNHFSSVWVFCPSAKAIHVDDTVGYYEDVSLSLRIVGIKKHTLQFHNSMDGPGLYHTKEAPLQFRDWVHAIINDWDFDIICCAHKNNVLEGGKAMLAECLDKATPTLEKLSKQNGKKKVRPVDEEKESNMSKTNYCGNECG
jgi:hypothetical protein